MRKKRCVALCTVNQINHRRGTERQCEENALPGDPQLCWVHQKAFLNPNRSEPLRLAPQDSHEAL